MCVNLQDVLQLYEQSLCDRVFHFELSNDQILEIVFYREQFCHLIGLQHIFQSQTAFYTGRKGYLKIKEGKLRTEDLIAHNAKAYRAQKERIECFHKILDIMQYGQVVRFYPDRTHPSTRIQAEFLIYEKDHLNIYHLFLGKEKETLYAPVSFLVKTNKDKQAKQFITGQEYKTILCRNCYIK